MRSSAQYNENATLTNVPLQACCVLKHLFKLATAIDSQSKLLFCESLLL